MRALLVLTMAAILAAGCDEESSSNADDTAGPADVAAEVAADSVLPDTGPQLPVPTEPELTGVEPIVPSSRLPARVTPMNANNNLDIVRHDGRIFLAFRTAETHFAGPEVVMYVVSSDDEESFDYETEFALGTDVREPRFLSFGGELFLYFTQLGDNPFDFQPEATWVSRYLGPGSWGDKELITFGGGAELPEGLLTWRTKAIDDVPYMLAYSGGENIYDLNGGDIAIFWMTTDDGVEWVPVVPGQPVVQTGGGSETAFVFDEAGRVIAVTRNEKGDDTGWGSKICRAMPESLGDWECVGDPKKYDSPIMFRHGSQILLIGRRNLTDSGNYDLGHSEGTKEDKTLDYLLDYSNNPKRCSVWEVDPDALTVSFVLDLPSRGDTCFPAVAVVDAHHYLVYNYSSPLDGEDVTWLDGQMGPTLIHRMLLGLP